MNKGSYSFRLGHFECTVINDGMFIVPEIKPKQSLIIFDEIQECPTALNSLKYFNEQANEYHIIAAGSLLGVKMNKSKGFPVGKVNFLHLYPLSFFEFLSATGKERLRNYLQEQTDKIQY